MSPSLESNEVPSAGPPLGPFCPSTCANLKQISCDALRDLTKRQKLCCQLSIALPHGAAHYTAEPPTPTDTSPQTPGAESTNVLRQAELRQRKCLRFSKSSRLLKFASTLSQNVRQVEGALSQFRIDSNTFPCMDHMPIYVNTHIYVSILSACVWQKKTLPTILRLTARLPPPCELDLRNADYERLKTNALSTPTTFMASIVSSNLCMGQ